MTILSSFQPNQIVCIEQGGIRLFAEVIQVSDVRPVSWVRPLLISGVPLDWNCSGAEQTVADQVYDLREGIDLLWPSELLRVAIDTEVIPLLAQLCTQKAQSGDRLVHQYLKNFIWQVWQAYPDAFQFKSSQLLNQQTLD